jgi:prepilin-type N-terminal cleavage/methylation domain-containing protein/prepilin-type processing-associated H-X9-DG protein
VSDFEEYLKRLTSHLDLDPKRTQEVCDETRCHLNARQRQFETRGMNPAEAAEAAEASFGEPRKLAAELSKANVRHRTLTPLRAVLAVLLVGGATLAQVGIDAPWPREWAWRIADSTSLVLTEARLVVTVLVVSPTAVLAGIIAGRRYCWLAGSPLFLWGALFWALSAAQMAIVSHGSGRETFAVMVMMPFVGGGVLAGFGRLGAWLGQRGSVRGTVVAICTIYLIGLAGLSALTSASDAVGRWAIVVGVESAAGLVGVCVLLASPAARRHVFPVAAGIWVMCLVAIIATARNPNYAQNPYQWGGIAVLQALFFVVGLLQYRTLTHGRPRRTDSLRAGFTLIELLVVLALVGILAGITMSVVSGARGRAREATCMSNLKQLVTAVQMYAGDYDDGLLPRPFNVLPGCEIPRPRDEDGHSILLDAANTYLLTGYAPYGASVDVWHCPSQPWPDSPKAGRQLVKDMYRKQWVVTADLPNPYYLTYYYTWLERLRPEEAYKLKDRPDTAFLIDYVVADKFLMGPHRFEPDGRGGWRWLMDGPHGGTRLYTAYLDGHVASVRAEDRPGEEFLSW